MVLKNVYTLAFLAFMSKSICVGAKMSRIGVGSNLTQKYKSRVEMINYTPKSFAATVLTKMENKTL